MVRGWLTVKKLMSNMIQATTIKAGFKGEKFKGEEVLIPRIPNILNRYAVILDIVFEFPCFRTGTLPLRLFVNIVNIVYHQVLSTDFDSIQINHI